MRQAIIWTNVGKFTDAYMHHSASMVLDLFLECENQQTMNKSIFRWIPSPEPDAIIFCQIDPY